MQMLRNTLGYVAAAAIGWWVWSGPVQEMKQASAEESQQTNERNMARCLRTREFAAGISDRAAEDPVRQCASKYGLYRRDGQWVAANSG